MPLTCTKAATSLIRQVSVHMSMTVSGVQEPRYRRELSFMVRFISRLSPMQEAGRKADSSFQDAGPLTVKPSRTRIEGRGGSPGFLGYVV